MDDAKRAEAANRKLLHGTKPTVVRPDPTTPIAQRSRGRKKRQEPPCPINVRGPKLGGMINDWLTIIRQEVDKQQKVTKSVESTDSQSGQSEEDMNGILVCIYDRQCKICYNQNRPRTNICSQPASSCSNVGNNMSLTGSNCFGPSNNCNEPSNNYRKLWPSDSFSDLSTFACQSNTGYEQRNISFRHPNVCLDSQLQASSNQLHVSNNQFEASNTKHMFQLSKCRFQQPNAGFKQASACFKPPNKASKVPNTAFDQLQISHGPYLSEKPDTCCSQLIASYNDPV